MWNPIQTFKDDLYATNWVWGRYKVVFFYAKVWFMIAVCAAWFVVPLDYGWGGFMVLDSSSFASDNSDSNGQQVQSIQAWVDLLTHLLVFFILSFFLFLSYQGATRSNLKILLGAVLMTHGIIGYYAYRDNGALLSLEDEETKTLWLDMFLCRAIVDTICPLMALICAQIEGCSQKRTKSPPPGYEALAYIA